MQSSFGPCGMPRQINSGTFALISRPELAPSILVVDAGGALTAVVWLTRNGPSGHLGHFRVNLIARISTIDPSRANVHSPADRFGLLGSEPIA